MINPAVADPHALLQPKPNRSAIEMEQSPRQLRPAQARLQDRLGKTASRQPLRRAVTKTLAGAGSAAGGRSRTVAIKPRFGRSKRA